MKQCQHCGFDGIEDNAIYCPSCGKKLEEDYIICPSCGEKNDISNTYCSQCGTNIQNSIIKNAKKAPANGLSNASMVLGIVGLSVEVISFFIFGWLSIPGLVCSIIGIILASKSKDNSGAQKAGFVTSLLGIILGVVCLILWIITLFSIFRYGIR